MPSPTTEHDQQPDAERGFAAYVDRWLERAGDRLNPILVKESRQSLQSRQFVITFGLLLVCGWGWSMLGVAMLLPGVYYTPSGPFLLVGYYYILAVPMLLIVPFATYRSLASECDGGTYELLSITTLSSRQIVTGKLGSAVVQMVVYYSALSPCIAFTYLLRGIDIITILLILVYIFLASLLLSTVGAMIAAATRIPHVQLLLSMVFLLVLAVVTLYAFAGLHEFVMGGGGMDYRDANVWSAQAAAITALVTCMALFAFAASAQLSFASDNRSSRLRAVCLVQQTLFSAWMLYCWLTVGDEDVLSTLVAISGGYWMLMGVLMTGEQPKLSRRVQRSLPQTFLGRVFLTWFTPGSGTGFVFAVTNLAAVTTLVLITNTVAASMDFVGGARDAHLVFFSVLVCAYVTAYLGVGRLIVMWLRRFFRLGLLLTLIVHGSLIAIGAAFPAFIHVLAVGFGAPRRYTVLQTTNWNWTLGELYDGNIAVTTVASTLVVIGAVAIFVVNLAAAAREVEQVRQETPQRIKQDEIALHPELVTPEIQPRNPLDD